LDAPLQKSHGIDAVLRDAAVTTSGFQGVPDQWFGGPALSANAGSLVLKDAKGHIVDSVNYGGVTDPALAEGYQAISGLDKAGCFAPTPGAAGEWGRPVIATGASVGRYPDGADSDSNCTDFHAPISTLLAARIPAGAAVIKVETVRDFAPGQTLVIGTGAQREIAVIAAVGSPGATTATEATTAGAIAMSVAGRKGFDKGQTVVIGEGAEAEEAVIADIHSRGASHWLVFAAPLQRPHAAGVAVSGTGLRSTGPLRQAHEAGVQITTDLPTPGKPNRYAGSKPKI